MRGHFKKRILAQVLDLLCGGGKEKIRYNTGMSIGSKLIFLVEYCYFIQERSLF